ncbi:hypothetical protein [Streptomyces sp. NPDC002851]
MGEVRLEGGGFGVVEDPEGVRPNGLVDIGVTGVTGARPVPAAMTTTVATAMTTSVATAMTTAVAAATTTAMTTTVATAVAERIPAVGVVRARAHAVTPRSSSASFIERSA